MTISPRSLRVPPQAALLTIASLIVCPPLAAQGAPGFRFGVAFGGTGSIGLTVEHRWEDVALELTVGTLSFRDVSVSAVAKHYAGGGALHPYMGAGLWTLVAFPPEEEERTGWVMIFRAPVGLDWNVADAHFFGLEINLNRALAVKRTDPEDRRGPQSRIVPLPALHYRWAEKQPEGR